MTTFQAPNTAVVAYVPTQQRGGEGRNLLLLMLKHLLTVRTSGDNLTMFASDVALLISVTSESSFFNAMKTPYYIICSFLLV